MAVPAPVGCESLYVDSCPAERRAAVHDMLQLWEELEQSYAHRVVVLNALGGMRADDFDARVQQEVNMLHRLQAASADLLQLVDERQRLQEDVETGAATTETLTALQRLTTQLREEIEQWEAQHGCCFLWRGVRYLDSMRYEAARARDSHALLPLSA
eukprot:PLAT12116.1.p2 GENE.PLAT12116.1~~PLAT12116.1.p2  ORF type:complete len:157 (+),score=75.57 PLAT12116.1:2-472(+)